MLKCIDSVKTYDPEDTRVVVLIGTEPPTGKTTGAGIDGMPDAAAIGDGSTCKDVANDKDYAYLGGTWYEINK